MIVDNFSFRIAEMTDSLTRDRPDGAKLSVEEILSNVLTKVDIWICILYLLTPN